MRTMYATAIEHHRHQEDGFRPQLVRWKNLLRPHVGPIGTLRWVLRENLAAGRASDDAAVSVVFQTFEPALPDWRIAHVFERERRAGRPVHFELVAAPPDSLVVSLASRRSWARRVVALDGVTMQIEPTFHCFAEVDDPETWRETVAGAVRKDDVDDLGRFLSLHP
ncbi:MAG: hypothetical protein NXI30_09145 [bacterium]|nr:hypothetical protein [bacterium]